MKNKFLALLSSFFFFIGCTYDSICPDSEDWGEFELMETSKELLKNLNHNAKAVFLDSTGKVITYTLSRDNRFFTREFNCDHDGNGIINSGDPLVFKTHHQAYNVHYYGSDFYDIFLSMRVDLPSDFDPLTKENFENNIFDKLYISIHAYYNQPAMNWIVDKRNGMEPSYEYQVYYTQEVTLGNKTFTDVYWDDKQLNNGYSKYIIYFNKDYGIVGVKHAENGYLIYFDHVE